MTLPWQGLDRTISRGPFQPQRVCDPRGTRSFRYLTGYPTAAPSTTLQGLRWAQAGPAPSARSSRAAAAPGTAPLPPRCGRPRPAAPDGPAPPLAQIAALHPRPVPPLPRCPQGSAHAPLGGRRSRGTARSRFPNGGGAARVASAPPKMSGNGSAPTAASRAAGSCSFPRGRRAATRVGTESVARSAQGNEVKTSENVASS